MKKLLFSVIMMGFISITVADEVWMTDSYQLLSVRTNEETICVKYKNHETDPKWDGWACCDYSPQILSTLLTAYSTKVQTRLKIHFPDPRYSSTKRNKLIFLEYPSYMITGVSLIEDASEINIFNVKSAPFYAIGDGQTNDRAAIQQALDLAAVAGGTVFLPRGIYSINCISGSKFAYGLKVGSNVKLLGEGRGATIIKLKDSQFDECRIIVNANAENDDGKGDSLITYEDFTVDGNSKMQNRSSSNVGIQNLHAKNVVLNRILVKNVNGDRPNGKRSNEGGNFDSYSSSHITYNNCEATTDPTEFSGSGFGTSHSYDITYNNCTASKSRYWQGFTAMHCRGLMYSNCKSYLNHERGFNLEYSENVQYINCIAGGMTSESYDRKGTPLHFPYESSKNMGNGTGFSFNDNSSNIILNNCISQGNGLYGIYSGTASHILINGGIISNNGIDTSHNDAGGIFLNNYLKMRTIKITGSPIIKDNKSPIKVLDPNNKSWTINVRPNMKKLKAPPFPPSTHCMDNPYPFDVTLYVFNHDSGVGIDGSNIWGFSSGTLKLKAGSCVRFEYKQQPKWTWFMDL